MQRLAFNVIVVGGGIWGESVLECYRKAGQSACIIYDHDGLGQRAASDDVARIIRAEYSDPAYCELANRALEIYRTSEPYVTHYHEPGWFLIQEPTDQRYESIPAGKDQVSVDAFKSHFPDASLETQAIVTTTNRVGWVEANDLQKALKEDCTSHRIFGQVVSLLRREKACCGVRLNNMEIHGSQVILATGWRTNELLRISGLPTLQYDIVGAVVLGVQLNQEQFDKYKNKKIICDPGLGEILPPTREKILRINSAHTFLFDKHTRNPPNVESSHPCFREPKAFLKQYCSDLVECPIVISRVCLDALTKGQTFYIEKDYGLNNLHCVGGGSFHSWKFRPVLPDILASQLVFQNRDNLWDALSQQQPSKHAGVVPAGRWTEKY